MLGVCALGAGALEGCGSQACLWGGEGIPPPLNGRAGSIGIVARLTLGDSMQKNDLAPSFGTFIPPCASWVRTAAQARPLSWPRPPGGWPQDVERRPVCVQRPAVSSARSPLPWVGPEEKMSSSAFTAPAAFLVGGGQSRLWTRGSEHL